MNTQTWSARYSHARLAIPSSLLFDDSSSLNCFFCLRCLDFLSCVLQGADAAGTVKDHGGSDEEATGKPKKRQLC